MIVHQSRIDLITIAIKRFELAFKLVEANNYNVAIFTLKILDAFCGNHGSTIIDVMFRHCVHAINGGQYNV